jgi:pimeloyl-[acyl-carrier protein] methyl ester esterase
MRLHIEVLGQGPDLVLIHGWGMHGGVWQSVVVPLAEHYRLHLVDLPGMGLSPTCNPYDLQALADTVRSAFPVGAHLCGWSLGGAVATRIALDAPDEVASLTLVGSTPRFVNAQDWTYGIAREVFETFAEQVTANYAQTMDKFLGLQAFGGEATRHQIRELKERFAARPAPVPDVLQSALKILLETDLRQACVALNVPLRIIHGDRDMLAPVSAARWMAETLPQANLITIPGASHAPFISHPGAFVAAMTGNT